MMSISTAGNGDEEANESVDILPAKRRLARRDRSGDGGDYTKM
jgi:hypothetical protein